MKRILGLDLGTNSIGGALVDKDFEAKNSCLAILYHISEERENWFKYRTYWFEKHVIDNYLTKIFMQNK